MRLFFFLFLLAVPGLAAAGEEEAEGAAEDGETSRTASEKSAPDEPAPAENPENEEVAPAASLSPEEVYQRGKAAFARGEYEAALADFAEVHRSTNHPALLFNMAQAHRLSGKGHCTEATRLYKSYLEEEPNVPNESEVRERIQQLEECAEEERVERESVARPAAPESPPPQRAPVLSKVLTVVGTAAAVVGGGMLAAAHVKYGSAGDECPCEPDRFETWEAVESVSYGLIGVGVPLAATGGIWWWASSSSAPVGADLGAPGFVVGVRGSF